MEDTKEGIITGFNASWQSGLATLFLRTEEGEVGIMCDNGRTVRALNDAFEGFITDGHTVDPNVIIGHRIVAHLDFLGMMGGFEVIS